MTTTTRKAICFYCDGLRDVSDSGICLGCGSNVPRNAPVTIHRQQHCPKCTDGLLRRLSDGMFLTCTGCGYTSGTAMDRTFQRRG
jgi:predicted amidophosphoribosyltransferase